MPRRLLITCVPPDRPHPSGRLAKRLQLDGVDVFALFQNSRSTLNLIRDALSLAAVLRKTNYDEAQVNVNGSIAQAIAVGMCRWYGSRTTLWIMDSYPGCLRYVTRYWLFFYPFFFVGSLLAKHFADQILIIDEVFATHSPTWQKFRNKCVYTPLPQVQMANDSQSTQKVPTLGILGNIEASWLAEDFEALYRQARINGYRLLIATSHVIDTSYFSANGIDTVIPWKEKDTERVFAQCAAILVPLSVARLIYSSPSKIIDCYLRGIQPVVMTDKQAWEANRDRAIYKKCVHISDFFEYQKKFPPEELLAYSQAWLIPQVQVVLAGAVSKRESYRDATRNDLFSVTRLHISAFPGFFLTSLGAPFVRTMYKAFLLNRNGIFLVNGQQDALNGFAVGTYAGADKATDRRLALKLLPEFIWTLLPAVLRNPVVVFRRVVGQFLANDVAPSIPQGAAVLRSIGVAATHRGQGTAGALLRAFEQRAYDKGAACVALTTDVFDNERAINFYRKHGYRIEQEFKQDNRRAMILMLKELR